MPLSGHLCAFAPIARLGHIWSFQALGPFHSQNGLRGYPALPSLRRGPYPSGVRFSLTHLFSADPEKVAAALLDPAFQASLSDIGSLADRAVLSQGEKDGLVVRRVRCVLDIDVKGPAQKFLGDSDPAWVEVAEWHEPDMTWRWHVEPEVAANLLEAHGTTVLSAADGGGTVRTIEGEVKVKVPFYGGKVEGWVVEGLEHAYDEEAERLTDWLE